MTIKQVSLLLFVVAIYSASGFFTKQAAGYSFMSITYILFLCGVLGVLAIYAALWQFALKSIPLHQAYPFRSLNIVFNLAIAYFAFHESVTWQNILGSIIVLSGLIIITTSK